MRVNRLPEAERGFTEGNGPSSLTFSFHFFCFAFLILGKSEQRQAIPTLLCISYASGEWAGAH